MLRRTQPESGDDMKPNRFAALLLLLIIAALCYEYCYPAETVTVSARNWGPDSTTRDAKIAAHYMAFADANNATGDISWLAQYEYTLSDSAVQYIDWSQDDPIPVKRYFNPLSPVPGECPVSPVWATVSRHSPAKVKYAKFSTWQGGPYPTGVKPMTPGHMKQLAKDIAKTKSAVAVMVADGKDWKKDGKKLTDKEKRAAAWRVATGKDKAEEYEKTDKVK